MKHPALARIFSLVLVVLCLTMLLAGLGSVNKAMRERTKSLAAYDRLTDRIEEYRALRQALADGKSYDEANAALEQDLEQHESDAAQHRMDLAVYTATRSGLQTGEDALNQAESAFQEGKAQYLAGLKLFEEQEKAFWEGYEQFQQGKKQLEEGAKTLALARQTVNALQSQLEQSKNLTSILESDDEQARQQLTVAAYDSMLSALDEATRLYTTLKDQGGISPEQVQAVLLMLQQSNPDLDLGDLDLEELTEAIAFEGISEEDLQRLEDEIVERTGMTVEELRASIQQQRDEIAAMDGESPLTEEQFEQLKQAYAANKEQVDQVTATISEQIQDLRAQLDEAEGQMNAAREQMAQMEPMMEQGKSAIEQARAALDMAGSQMAMGEQGLAEGRRQLEEQQKELKEKEEQLRREKEQLDREAQTLADQSAEVSDRKETERRETSVRLMLLEREEIQSRVEGGMELLDACDDYAAQMLSETEKNYSDRLVISLLMILGGIAGFVGLPAAFEKTNSRFWLIAPVLLCLGCGAAAEVLCRLQGRGDSYSALGAAIFALIQLVLVIPKKKKA